MNDQERTQYLSFQSPNYSAVCINKNIAKKHGADVALFYAFIADEKASIIEDQTYRKHLIDETGCNFRDFDEDGYFPVTHQYITDSIGLSSHKIRACKAVLKELGLIETLMKGMPAKEYYLLKGVF